jgi:hypothetical protein
LADTARNYADPFIEFEFEDIPVGDKVCIVIKIQEFEELPVICKKPFGDILKSGAIYARSYVKRESAEVRSQSEIRDILNMATEKSARKFIGMASRVGMPLTLRPTDSEKFDKQLQEFLTSDDQVKAKIKSKGYWEIVIRCSGINPLISKRFLLGSSLFSLTPIIIFPPPGVLANASKSLVISTFESLSNMCDSLKSRFRNSPLIRRGSISLISIGDQ